MVLQRDRPVPVWGSADPGEKVTVTFNGQRREAVADGSGRWKVMLDPMPANASPQPLEVHGKNAVILTNVLIGEVWIGSGQSNMQWSVGQSMNAAEEIAAANHPEIRLFQVPLTSRPEPQQDVNASWTACTPETVNNFSAVLYFMGRDLRRELNVPIGLINSSWGGSRIEPWTPVEGFSQVRGQETIARLIRASTPGTREFRESMESWLREIDAWRGRAKAAVEKNQPPPPLPDRPGPLPHGYQQVVGLYNAMIHPLVPFAIRGAVWYQGESNNGEGMAYVDRMKALIAGWRTVWGQGDFPFYFVQLAPFNYGGLPPEEARKVTSLAEIQHAQSVAARVIPNTGMVVTTDIGNVADIHPVNKQEVGRRLSLIALARDYGRQDLVWSGPVFRESVVEGGRIRVRFDHTGGGLVTRNGEAPDWFEIAGEDGVFVPAAAAIDGNDVVVSSPQVPKPVRVRFAWSQMAEPNLMNREGLPASCFRTE